MNWFGVAAAATAFLVIAACVLFPFGVALPISIGLAIAFLVLLGLGVAFIHLNFFMPALCRGRSGARTVALTYDDGPDPAATEQLLDELRTANAVATFFCVGERARAFPHIVKRMVDEGHLIGNHSQHHGWWTNFLFGSFMTRELREAQDSIAGASGVVPQYYRPPLGLMNPHYRTALRCLGLRLVGWDIRSYDLRADPIATIAERITRKVRPGSIIALHDAGPGPERVTELARTLIVTLRDQGYSLVRVDQLDRGP